jgi:hypothetical protein
MRWVALALLFARTAAAQPPGETPPSDGDKSLLDAYLITVGATSGPMIVAAIAAGDSDRGPRATAAGIIGTAGLLLGPSAGHWYAGEGITTGLELRLGAGAAIATLAFADPHLDHDATVLGLIGALGLWEVGIAWDCATLPRAVRRANRLRLAPVVTPNGFAIAGSF